KPYEESVHVPLVVRGPGFRGGGSAHQTVSLADVTATIRRIGGVTRSHGADGVPLEQVRAHPTSFGRRPVEIEGSVSGYPHWTTMPTDRIGRFYEGAVWGPYSLVHWETGDWEFYNRKKDPWQMRNSYSTHPRPGSPQALLQAWFRHHVDCRGPACNDLITRP
ncbi:MAG: hypothetical protein J2P22_14060, partial [Nocardioides sp.]|nr:hypothetical protein [Nocardioides sp.]